MKTKAFIKSVEALGFQTYVNGKKIKVCDGMRGYGADDPMFILTSDLPEVYVPNEFYISSLERRGVLKLIVEYLDTPNSEREEEKRYRLRFNVPLLGNSGEYLFMNDSKKQIYIGTGEWFGCRNIFTESEIAEMDITGFEKEPVE